MTNHDFYQPLPGRKFRSAGLDANTKVYGFYVRLDGDSRDKFREVKKRLTEYLGSEPSNPMVFDFLLKSFFEIQRNVDNE
jgi:hypothetical protein